MVTYSILNFHIKFTMLHKHKLRNNDKIIAANLSDMHFWLFTGLIV